MYKQCILLNERHPLICLRLRLLYAGFGIIKKIFLQSQQLFNEDKTPTINVHVYQRNIDIDFRVLCICGNVLWPRKIQN